MEKEKVGVLSPGASHEVSLVLTTSTLLPNLAQDSISTSLVGEGRVGLYVPSCFKALHNVTGPICLSLYPQCEIFGERTFSKKYVKFNS